MENVNNKSCSKTTIYALTAVATFLLMAFLVNKMIKVTQPPAVGAERATARAKDNADIRGAGATALQSWGYVAEPATARPQGIVRTPIEEAIQATIKGYQNPAGFRADLAKRAEKAFSTPSFE
jgi:uncharacterized protein YfaQ (DUF2300 family)